MTLAKKLENSPCLDKGVLACPDPACRKAKVHIPSLLDLVHHLILVHYFSPFVGGYLKVGLLKPVDTLVPLNSSDIDEIADAKTNQEFVPAGVVAERSKTKSGIKKSKVSCVIMLVEIRLSMEETRFERYLNRGCYNRQSGRSSRKRRSIKEAKEEGEG